MRKYTQKTKGLFIMSRENAKSSNEWRKIILNFRASGKSQVAWCKENKINLSTFNTWYKRLKDEIDLPPESAEWVPIKLEEAAKKSNPPLINIKLGNAVIEINSEFDADHLLKIVKVLNSIC